jgi:hypothetical protein
VAWLARNEIFVTVGMTVLRNSRRFGVTSTAIVASPVTLAPGLARLATRPEPTGSALKAITIGIVFVALAAARIAAVGHATRMSTFRRINSVARAGSRSILFSAYRHSMRTLCPSVYPCRRSPSRNAASSMLEAQPADKLSIRHAFTACCA